VSTTATRVTKISTVIIAVADQDAMIDFYVDKLGFEKRVDVPFGGQYRWVEVGLPGAETTIALAPPPEGVPTGGTQTGIALNAADVDAVHADYRSRGVDVDEQVSRMGDEVPAMFWLRDPEKNVLMVVEGA
jgi:catechol 2,3-dioxygenase-like lactoylglutathione lyase family enzyme